MSLSQKNLVAKLSEFVKKVCNGRDESHGYEHMKKVAENARQIYEHQSIDKSNRNSYIILENVLIVAWLHDVADHKYDLDGTLETKIHNFLVKLLKDQKRVELIQNIIHRISYSKENKIVQSGRKPEEEWKKVLGDEGLIIRNIVSDADKLEALGKIGMERCIMYTKERSPGISYEKLVENVKAHSKEKLLRLKDEFIRTKYGKKLAEPLHQEFIECLNEL